jgi:ferredoxin
MPKLTIENRGLVVEYNPAISLLNNLRILDIDIGSMCGGRGNCGTCRVQVLEGERFLLHPNDIERFRLSEVEINQNWRLACQLYSIKDLTINIPKPSRNKSNKL